MVGVTLAVKYNIENTHIGILDDKFNPIISNFSSKKKQLNDFLKNDALEYQKLNLGVTYLLLDSNCEKVISYVTFGMGALKIPDPKTFEFKGKILKNYPKEFPNSFPAMRIGQLATTKDEESRGGARLLMDYAVKLALEYRKGVGCAYLIADAYPDVVEVYKKFGFKTYIKKFAGRKTIPMYFELSTSKI